jgi:Tol biopolymer transport system component
MDVYLYDRGLRTLRLVSHTASGAAGSAVSRSPQLSGDGRYVAFTSTASDLVPGDTGAVDVFRYDRLTDEVVRVSVAANGGQANGDSDQPQISDDGTVVAFSSTAFNLVADDVNGTSDIFVRDLAAGTNRLISVASTGSQADLASQNPALSGDGRVVAFSSLATNLVAGDTNQVEDVFVHELATDVTARVSVTSTGVQADGVSRFPSLSRDGRFISFLSRASNLVPPTAALFFAYVHDRQSRITLRGAESDVQSAWLSSDGRYLSLHTGSGAFVRDRFAGTSRALPGIGASRLFPVISGDGRYIAFLNGTTGDVLVAPN